MIIASSSEFDQLRLSRVRHLNIFADRTIAFASPEDVILKKLVYFREGQSSKHIRDIAGVLRIQGDRIDREYIRTWAERLGVMAEWLQIEAETA